MKMRSRQRVRLRQDVCFGPDYSSSSWDDRRNMELAGWVSEINKNRLPDSLNHTGIKRAIINATNINN